MASNEALKRCPACGKPAGKLIENKPARFPFRVQCGACGWMTRSGEARRSSGEAMERGKARGQGTSASEMKSPAEAGRGGHEPPRY
jgi:hypothetical protein